MKRVKSMPFFRYAFYPWDMTYFRWWGWNMYGRVAFVLCLSLIALMFCEVAQALTLAWDAPVTDQPPASYNVYRNLNGGLWGAPTNVVVPTQTYTDPTPPVSGTYCYQVTALYGAGVGESAPATIQGGSSTKLCFPPQPPGQLRKQ